MSTADDLLRRVVEMCNVEDWDTDSNFDELLGEINTYLIEAPKDEPVAWPINGEIAKRIVEKQCVSYEVVQLIAREILSLHPPTKTAPMKPMTVEEMKEAWGQPGHLSTAVLIAYTRAIERHHGIGGGDE